jgi:hypothetical protein
MKQYSFHSLSSSVPEGARRNILRPSYHQSSALFEKVTAAITRTRRSVSAPKRTVLVAVVSETEGLASLGVERSLAQVAIRAVLGRDAEFGAVGKDWDRIVAIVRCAGIHVSLTQVERATWVGLPTSSHNALQ